MSIEEIKRVLWVIAEDSFSMSDGSLLFLQEILAYYLGRGGQGNYGVLYYLEDT